MQNWKMKAKMSPELKNTVITCLFYSIIELFWNFQQLYTESTVHGMPFGFLTVQH